MSKSLSKQMCFWIQWPLSEHWFTIFFTLCIINGAELLQRLNFNWSPVLRFAIVTDNSWKLILSLLWCHQRSLFRFYLLFIAVVSNSESHLLENIELTKCVSCLYTFVTLMDILLYIWFVYVDFCCRDNLSKISLLLKCYLGLDAISLSENVMIL